MIRPTSARWRAVRTLPTTALFVLFSAAMLSAQVVQQSADPMKKRGMTIDDYTRWRNIESATI